MNPAADTNKQFKQIKYMKNTIEKMVCETIQQEPIEVQVNETTYRVAPPTVATLIEVSKYISQLPEITMQDDFKAALAYACECEFVGDIVAILMLGKKHLVVERQVKKRKFFGLIEYTHTESVNRQSELARMLLEELSPKELSSLGNEILQKMEIGFFLGFTTSLLEVNLLRSTRMTQSGQ